LSIALSGGYFNGVAAPNGYYVGPGVDSFGQTFNSLVAYQIVVQNLYASGVPRESIITKVPVVLRYVVPGQSVSPSDTMLVVKDTTQIYRSSTAKEFCALDSLELRILNTSADFSASPPDFTIARDIIWYKNGVPTGISGPRFVVRESGFYYPEFTNEIGCRIVILDDAVRVRFYDPVVLAAPTFNEPITVRNQVVTGRSNAAMLNDQVLPPLETPLEARVEISVNGNAVGQVPIDSAGNWSFTYHKPFRHGDVVTARVFLMQKRVRESYSVEQVPVCLTESEITTTIVRLKDKEIHDFISPTNADGYNDKWIVMDGLPERYPKAEVRVYNRFGSLVYSKNSYQNDWDGGGLPDADYYFYLDLKDGSDPIRGILTIMR
jgi:gliding motility-associated-like protein